MREDFKRVPLERCTECGRIAPHYYDERDRHMSEEFKAGTTTTRLAKEYNLSQQRVQEIVIQRLGTEAYSRIVRTEAHNRETDNE